MVNSETVGQRFAQLITHLGISKNAFALSLDKTATVIQHLVDERNKPGFDLLCKVFEIYPNVSKDWLLQGAGSMLVTGESATNTSAAAPLTAAFKAADAQPAPATQVPPAAEAPAPTLAATPPPEPVAVQAAPVALAASDQLLTASFSPPVASVAPAVPTPLLAPAGSEPLPVAVPTAPPVPAAAPPVVAAPDVSWQTALYTQQMAHQLAMAELRNQHLQDQQRMMQQMMDMMKQQMGK